MRRPAGLSRRGSLPAVIVLAIAALLRLAPITAGVPYISYIDEGHVLQPVIGILKHDTRDSRLYTYPPLTSYLTVIAIKVYAPIYQLVHHRALQDDLPSDSDLHTALGDYYDLIAPPDLICLGRLVVAVLSLGTVAIAGRLATLLGNSHAGLLAIVFTALCPPLVTRGSITIIDTTAAFFALAALYFCERLRVSQTSRWNAALAGASAGLAFGAKYTVGFVFVAVLVTIATVAVDRKSKSILGSIAAAGLLAGVFCAVPAAVIHPGRIVAELRGQAAFYQSIHSVQSYWGAALSNQEIGAPLLIAGLAGLVWMSFHNATRKVCWTWFSFALLLILVVGWAKFQPFRNLLSLVPLLCVAAAIACTALWRYFKERKLTWGVGALAVGIFVLSVSLAGSSIRQLHERMAVVDTRVQAINWVKNHAPPGATVLGIRELAILPAEWKRLAANSTIVSWFEASDRLARQQFDYVVTSEFDLRHATDARAWAAYRDNWQSTTSPLTLAASFGRIATPVVPYLWRTNDERVLILKNR